VGRKTINNPYFRLGVQITCVSARP
jgi:hypothetical protein